MGILLFVLLVLILLILAVLLFAPIRWETGAKAARLPHPFFRAFLKVRWLAGAISFQIRANETTVAVRLKLFGRVFRQTAFRWRYPFAEEEMPERRISRETTAEKSSSEPAKSPERKRTSPPRKTPEPEKTAKQEAPEPKKNEPERTADPVAESTGASKSVKQSSENKEESLIDWVKEQWAAIHEPKNARVMGLVKEQAYRILRHLQPQTVRVHAVVGLSDPAETGILLGTFYAFWPLFADAGDFRLAGDFERKTLEGKLYLKGRVRNAVFASAVFRLFRDQEIRSRVISYFKN